jgi:hypothetical protein
MSKSAGFLKRDPWKALSATIALRLIGCKAHPDGVRLACEAGKSLFSGRIEIQGVLKFCFLRNPVSGGFPPA